MLGPMTSAFYFFHLYFISGLFLSRDAGYVKSRPIKVARRKNDPNRGRLWISVTRNQATQRMKIRPRGSIKGEFLYMCLRLTSL